MNHYWHRQAVKRILGCAAIAFATVSAAVADDSGDKTITKSFTVEPGGMVAVNADQGDIELVTGKQNEIVIVVERTVSGQSDAHATSVLKSHKVTATAEGNNIYVETKMAKTYREETLKTKEPGLTVHIKVTSPTRFDARLETDGGIIRATGLEGAVEAKASGGDLAFTYIHGAVNGQTTGGNVTVTGGRDKLQVRTSGGNITVKDFNGSGAQLETLGGDISVVGCTGPLGTKTSGGDIHVEKFTGPQLYADTAGGGITAEMGGTMLTDSYLRTAGGDITLKVADVVTANLIASTEGGTITTAIPVSTAKGRLQENKLEGQINGGGPKLVVRTGGGNIDILKP